jgi:serine/threonine protein kinase
VNVQIPGYKIVRHIAEGGMASVYLAIQESLGRYVVIKRLKKFDDVYQSARFHHEGRIIASLNHRNIITIFDVGVIGERYYISMEYLEGGDLEEKMKSGMSAPAALNLLSIIGNCLDFLHEKDIIHRDIKPANILFHKDGTPLLTDFGVAKQQEVDINLTGAGLAMGSPYYISPEQAECKELDGRADIYSLGIILYEILTGSKPYSGDSYIETIVAHLNNPVPSLPPELECYQELIDRMIAKDRNERFSCAAEMVEYIDDLREGGLQPVAGRKALPFGSDHHSGNTLSGMALDGARTAFQKLNQLVVGNNRVFMAGALTVLLLMTTGYFSVKQPLVVTEAFQPVTDSGGGDDNHTVSFETRDDSEARFEEYLQKARQAQRKLRFASPKNDNAYYYYQMILKEDPEHEEALQGIAAIGEVYADLVEWALGMLEYKKAREYLYLGLRVDSGNKRLLELEDDRAFK